MYVVTSPSGHYQEACVSKGFCNPTQHVVVSFQRWSEWYNRQRFSRITIPVPPPAFVGNTYEIAKQAADELNDSAFQLTEGITK